MQTKNQLKALHSENGRKIAEKDLVDVQEIFKLVIDAVEEYAISALDPNGYILTWNAASERLTGYSAEEMIGQHLRRLYVEDDVKRKQPTFELAFASRQGKYQEEGLRVRKDGTTFLACTIITALHDENENLRGYGMLIKDLTQRRNVELALRQSEDRFRMMVENVQDYAIFMLDSKGYITTWNKGAERNKGWKAAEVIGKHFSIFYPEKDRLAGKPEWELGEAVKNGRVEDEGWRVRKDGSMFWANVTITPLHDEQQRLVGFTKVTRNLTERKNAEDTLRGSHALLEERIALRTRELEEAKNRAEEAVKAREQFFSMASHELKTPMFALKLKAQLRLRNLLRGKLSEFSKEKLKTMLEDDDRQIDRLAQLVERMLDISRLATGNLDLKLEECSLSEIITSVVSAVKPILDTSKNEVFVTCSEDIVGRWDRLRLEQVITNLLSNAGKYAPGKPVVVTAKTGPNSVQIDVRDFGPGIEEGDRRLIFEPFQRVMKESAEGLGLGLFICKKIVEAHGGSLEVDSILGQGSVFKVELPISS